MSTFICHSLEELDTIANAIITEFRNNRIFAFHGNMGVGKTTLIKRICKQLGVKEVANSPTFAIVNEYTYVDNQSIYHFDFYRLKNAAEAFDIGLEEYLASDAYCFMEWPEIVEAYLPEDTIAVYISEENEERKIVVG